MLAVSPSVWYVDTEGGPLFTLEDQQLAGIIMWVPGRILYVAAALRIAADWLRLAEIRTRDWERATKVVRHVG